MVSPLESLDVHLHAHFGKLAECKREAGHPVFALEHGLGPADLQVLEQGLEDDLRMLLHTHQPLTWRFWLCWVVHAAEHGYSFEGLEFWPSFAAKTPSWDRYSGVRDLLRSWFVHFKNTYHGVWPAGGWAANYRYIAWPITHALLPSDLQVRLAESMFLMRFRLGATRALTPSSVGKLVAAHTHHGSNRFLNFLAQEDLVGRIVLALLHADPDEQSAIHPPTLRRIIEDLKGTRQGHRMLQEARHHYQHSRFRTHGPTMLPGPFALVPQPDTEDDGPAASPVLVRTGVVLERSATGQWSATLQLPSFQALSNLHAEFARHLAECMVNIPCHGETWFPARTLVTGRRERSLRRWPADAEPLLQFNESLPGFDSLIAEECRLITIPCWVFRLTVDGGQAQLAALAAVHPGKRYLVLSRERDFLTVPATPLALACEGVYGYVFDVPAAPSDDYRRALTMAGISVGRGLHVEPLGILPRQWDGDSEGEWLTTETPAFSVRADHDSTAFEIAVDGETPVTLAPDAGKPDLMFTLPRLDPGRHTLTISARSGGGNGTAPTFSGRSVVRLMVREPSTWIPGQLCHPAMLVSVTPLSPSLDDLVDGRLLVQVEGDPARKATLTLVLLDASGAETSRQMLFSHSLPVRAADWKRGWSEVVQRARDDYAYLTACGGYIEVSGEDLGFFRVPLRREFHALRWAVRQGKPPTLRLVDDGEEGATAVSRYRFATPAAEEQESAQGFLAGVIAGAEGGLYVARAGDTERGLVVAPANPGRGWEALGSRIDEAAFAAQDLDALCLAYRRWSSSEPAGFPAKIRRDAVLRPLHRQILCVACGASWMRIEDLLTGPRAPVPNWDLVDAAAAGRHSDIEMRNFVIGLGHTWARATNPWTLERMRWQHAKDAAIYGWTDEALVAQAWNLAMEPRAFEPTSRQLTALHANARDAVLVRAARYLQLRLTCEGSQ